MRLFTTGRHKSRERVVECRPGEAFAYVLEAGLALRDYKAVVTLTPAGGGTAINWHSTFRPKVPGTGWLYRRELGTFISGPSTAWPRRRTGPRVAEFWPWAGGPGRALVAAAPRCPRGARRPGELGEGFEQGGLGLAEAALQPVEQGPEAVDGQAGLEEHGRGLREVDGGELEEPVAVVGHHDLGRGVGQLGPHGVDLGLRRRLLLGERCLP